MQAHGTAQQPVHLRRERIQVQRRHDGSALIPLLLAYAGWLFYYRHCFELPHSKRFFRNGE